MDRNLRTVDWNITTMDRNLRTVDWNVTTMDRNLRTVDWNITTMDRNLRTVDWNVTTMDRNLRTVDWNVTTMDRNLRTVDWNVTTMNRNLRTVDWNITTMDRSLRTVDWNVTTMDRGLMYSIEQFYVRYDIRSLKWRIYFALRILQYFYYPLLAAVGVPFNSVTIVILSWGKCGRSKCVTRYLVAMATADLLVIIIDLILRHIPTVYKEQFQFVLSLPVCNIHAVLLCTVTDCSVWFTVTFTFDRLVAICCQKLKTKYCTERTATVVLGTVTVLSGLKDITWYFFYTGSYRLTNIPWFCFESDYIPNSLVWASIAILHQILNPCVPFVLILLFNTFTIRHILVASRARRRLQGPSSGGSHKDPEMESRRKSIILLFLISGNFILLWSMYMLYFIHVLLFSLRHVIYIYLPLCIMNLGFMLQLLSCCTNTAIYAVTQSKFREQLKNLVKYPFILIVKCIKY
uniref:probable G-protein coupled receptor 139 n=1 Tax=Pristiophorus japonicus TaxID=55135 RepID=UPI00398EF3E9